MYAHTLFPFAGYCLRISLVLISCSRREGEREEERKKERERETLSPNCKQEIVQKTRRYLTLSPTRSVFPHSSFRPSIRPSIHHRIPEHEHGTRTTGYTKEKQRALSPSLSLLPSLDKNILSPIQTAKTLFGGPLLDLFLAF